MRIVGGELGGRSLAGALPRGLRPTSDRVREALFNLLGGAVAGTPFVDLCAGSGAVGFEAWSRGARPVRLVERHRASLKVIERNLGRLGLEGDPDAPVIVRADAGTLIERGDVVPGARTGLAGPSFVFLDPPYGEPRLRRWLAWLGRPGTLPAGTLLVVEHETRAAVPWPRSGGLEQAWSRRYGDTALSAARAEPAAAERSDG